MWLIYVVVLKITSKKSTEMDNAKPFSLLIYFFLCLATFSLPLPLPFAVALEICVRSLITGFRLTELT